MLPNFPMMRLPGVDRSVSKGTLTREHPPPPALISINAAPKMRGLHETAHNDGYGVTADYGAVDDEAEPSMIFAVPCTASSAR